MGDPNNTSILQINGTNEEDNGGISLYAGDATAIDEAYLVAWLPAPSYGLKAVVTPSGNVNFLLNCLAWPNGTAYNEAFAEEPLSRAKIYDSIYVRHWDTWLTERKYAVFAGTLAGGNRHSLRGSLRNLITNITNVTRAQSPVQPFGGSGDCDISPDGSSVIFLTKNIDLPLANYTSAQIWLVPHNGSRAAVPVNAFSGSSTPRNARDEWHLLRVGQERDLRRERNPSNFNITAPDGLSLFVAGPDLGNERLFQVPLTASATFQPTNIANAGVVAASYVLPNGNLLSNEVDPELAGLGPRGVSEFYTAGGNTQVQSWIIYPTGFNASRTYPLVFVVHGGPQGGHYNSWSTRWNFRVWADQGYVVVALNPTGITGWGMTFQAAIQDNWGSYVNFAILRIAALFSPRPVFVIKAIMTNVCSQPYEDLFAFWEYVNSTFDHIDTETGIEAGASYGGYMTNFIQGHDLGRRFKALVTHDGMTNAQGSYSTEELLFNGTLWANRVNYDEFNPLNCISEWATPHFVVHNELDYRLPISEGLMHFNILQLRGVPSRFLSFPDENHWVLNRENSLVWHREIFAWINHYPGISK
ncbi:hypothetical protein A1O7_07173 [Cladophialophora yegresii CBS 114405]|uniref:Dipeptidyl-peptidase V n=1 Tax=Cladophialophora yegresii CBS 114405 TaxID=1182544 RepID=W9WE86_9EURO|nr:uncharacterized protein A1O7_07173 [Cladophialophora yegresii CBS 114405]EXJ56829.1 hypothetical protein A1O7_07173 [Cladophialophora yegresii CBS 114405]